MTKNLEPSLKMIGESEQSETLEIQTITAPLQIDEVSKHSILSLPPELLPQIFDFLPCPILLQCAQVSRLWHETATANLWKSPNLNLIWKHMWGDALELTNCISRFPSFSSLRPHALKFLHIDDDEPELSPLDAVVDYLHDTCPRAYMRGAHVRQLIIDSRWLFNRPKDGRYKILLAGLASFCPNIINLCIDSRFSAYREDVDDDIMLRFNLANLQHFSVSSSSISDAVLFKLAESGNNLQSFAIAYCSTITKDGLLYLFGNCRKLKVVRLDDYRLAAPEITFAISQLRCLKEFSVVGYLNHIIDSKFADNSASSHAPDVQKLEVFPSLTKLLVNEPDNFDRPASVPSSLLSDVVNKTCATLNDLRVFGSFVDDNFLQKIGTYNSTIQVLKLGKCKLSVRGLKQIQKLGELRELEIRAASIESKNEMVDDSFIEAVCNPNLVKLFVKLRGLQVFFTDRSIVALMHCEKLETLWLQAHVSRYTFNEFDGYGDLQFKSLRKMCLYGGCGQIDERGRLSTLIMKFIEDRCEKLETFECESKAINFNVHAYLAKKWS
ncbi:hypothetical protein HK098_008085 [Nowakowskiella sp. JEL0407]|nr:hypothetical protein HK098_008071 [Nowakowskiella sp. JEL0407]KAJ3129851.1 hypothetical protein HK098_008085 [Nowakowskiella sp. JEL0407]